jgi:hypothetical protein
MAERGINSFRGSLLFVSSVNLVVVIPPDTICFLNEFIFSGDETGARAGRLSLPSGSHINWRAAPCLQAAWHGVQQSESESGSHTGGRSRT